METPKNQQSVIDFTNNAYIQDGILKLPTLWSLDKHNNYRYWDLNIGIEYSDTKKILDVTDDYINRKKLPIGCVGIYWTESGIEQTLKPIISEKTYVMTGKNINSKNY